MKKKKGKKGKRRRRRRRKTLCIGNAAISVTILRQKKSFSPHSILQKSKIRLVNEKCQKNIADYLILKSTA